MATNASVHAACVRLKLSSGAENVPLVRQALGGLADAIGLSPADLNDISTAVTEACTNASLHAYGGEEGPLEVELLADAGAIVAFVRDRGVGLTFDTRAPMEFPTDVDGQLAGIGVPSIQSLATNARWAQPDGGGTEVEMTFSIPLKALESGFPVALLEPAVVEPVALRDAIEVAMAPLEVARGVLPRRSRPFLGGETRRCSADRLDCAGDRGKLVDIRRCPSTCSSRRRFLGASDRLDRC
jgi:anti-sigma regulatory factor (Ser/Thr protein kinase)